MSLSRLITDDLQSVIKMLKGKDFDFHIEFVNYR
jgi:uncharacterized protein YajQ (UPF0234 family)